MPPLVPIIIGAALAASGVGGIILGGLTALTVGITGLGASLILGGLSRLLIPKFPGISDFTAEVRGRTITGRQVVSPWRVIYGKIRVGGVMTFLHVTGTKKEFLHIVITISGHEVEEIGLMYFDGVLVPVDGSGNATGKFLNHVHVEKNLGTDTQAAFPGLLADAPTKWTANHRQLGRAGVYVRLKFNPDKFPGQIPNITFDVKGKKVFDPRTSTTVFSENAALCFSDYLLDTDYGVGVPQSKIDNSAWIAAANLCEEQVALAAGGNEDRYTCNGSFLVSERPVDIMLALLTAMGGIAVYSGGFWFIYGAAFRSPALTFDEGDLRGPIRVQTRTARRDLFNAVKGLYVSAANNWQPSDFPPVTNAAFEAEDGGKRIFTDIELPYTISAATAQRLAKIELERSRRHKIVEVRFGPTALQAQPPDVIQLSVSRFGWSSKTFEVINEKLLLEEDADGTPRPEIVLTMRESDSTVYDWAAEEAAPSVPGTPDLPDTSIAAPPTGLVLSSFSITRTDGIRVTFLKAAWTAPVDEFVTAGGMIEVEYKKNSSGTWLPVSPVPGNETEKLIPNVDDGVAYDVRIRSVNVALAKSAFVQQLNFTVVGASSDFGGTIDGDAAADVQDGATRARLGLLVVGDLARNVITNRVIESSILGGAVAVSKLKAETVNRIFISSAKKTNVEALESGGNVATNKVPSGAIQGSAVVEAKIGGGAVAIAKLKTETVNRIWQSQTMRDAAVDSSGNILLKNLAKSFGATSNPTIASSTFADMPDMTKTITTKGNTVLISFNGKFQNNGTLATLEIRLVRDGTPIGLLATTSWQVTANNPLSLSVIHLDESPSAASHTWKIQWRSIGSKLITALETDREIEIEELG